MLYANREIALHKLTLHDAILVYICCKSAMACIKLSSAMALLVVRLCGVFMLLDPLQIAQRGGKIERFVAP